MIDILQPTSLIPYRNETEKIETVKKPAVIIPINAEAKTSLSKNKEQTETPLPFAEWTMPVQDEGYLKATRHDSL